jgi:hypothetical protein
MTEITANLTVAWLDAFARLQQPKTLLDEIEGATHRSGSKQTLSDVIENALRAGGAEPLSTEPLSTEPVKGPAPASAIAADNSAPASAQAIDLLV